MLARARPIAKAAWTPAGVEALEDNALLVATSEGHRSVIAGPGAGKTELLAQRAAFLLQTGTCPAPQRILAISYKRDAARNLTERVGRRCHRSHAARLDSQTFDAFAKSLVDRFGQTLPAAFRPRPNYKILEINKGLSGRFLGDLPDPPVGVGTKAQIMALNAGRFERNHLLRRPLPANGWGKLTPGGWAAAEFWSSALHEGKDSFLSFGMIGRLAELLVRTNPMVQQALRLTYSHLFMDEFQDTTQVQYDLVRTIFLGGTTVVTAVGDNKQQIMRWALAMDDPFAACDADFGTVPTPLYNNYRSSPDLVRIQHVLARALDKKAVKPVSKSASTIAGDSCEIWDFSTRDKEAKALAGFIAAEVAGGLKPRDFAILVRQKADDYAARLGPHLAAAGVSLRNEAAKVGAGTVALQDLLPEEASAIPIALLRLAMSQRAGRHWTKCLDIMTILRSIDPDDDDAHTRLARDLDGFATDLAKADPQPPKDRAAADAIVAKLLAFIGRGRLTSLVGRYQQGSWLDQLLEAAAAHLAESSNGAASWEAALDAYEGLHATPLMTIHKSKGLEYHTVIFVGLDDSAWWSFKDDETEATAGFFVAFTRARQRVVFTFCALAARTLIAPLYDLLAAASVKTIPKG